MLERLQITIPSCVSIVIEGEGRSAMDTAPPERPDRGPRSRVALTPASVILLSIAIGLCAGYLDLAIIVFKKFCWNPEGYYRVARDSPWSVPVGHAALMILPGALIAGLCRWRPGVVSVRAGSWLLATLAIWGALLRMPIYAWCSLLLAAGLGQRIGGAIADRGLGSRRSRSAAAGILGVLAVLAAGSSGWQSFREARMVGTLPAAPPRARNVILIVWDTVRARNLSLYGYDRETTPNLVKWASTGVTYQYAVSPAPWTFPAHTSFFTGRWPLAIDSQWKPRLDTPDSTLAEYLASRGYQTAGFAANTNCCTHDSGLDRGFAHYEDYSTDPASLFARTVPGRWLLQSALDLIGDYYGEKWVGLQSRDAMGINGSFLDWLGRRRADRPFFAFLNYFDAHDSYIPAPGFVGRFGLRPVSRREYQFLNDYYTPRPESTIRDYLMGRDCYDDCIAYLDEQLGRLLDQLERRGLLGDTDVIITSDHGEGFGEHGFVGHSNSVNAEEIRVPLVILSPGAPAGRTVFPAVSLRDLPATVVDRLGLSDGSPFPGRSLASYWGLPPGGGPPEPTSPAFSEQANRSARMLLRPMAGPGGVLPGFRMSLLSWNFHYIRDGEGGEELFDVVGDPVERVNLAGAEQHKAIVEAFRAMLLDVLAESPGSTEVEKVYLRGYRRSLETLVRDGATRRVVVDTRIGTDRDGPSRRPDS